MLNIEFYLSVLIFCFAATGTPGPNTIMLVASGLNHGIKHSIPHYLGISFGFPLMVLLIGFGLGAIFTNYPFVHQTIKVVGISYLLYLAWKIANTKSSDSSNGLKKPFTFLQAAAFQWVNPKAWVIAIGAIGTFTTYGNISAQVVFITFCYFLASITCMGLWLILGASLQRLIRQPKQFQIFNITMAILLVASIVPMIFVQLSSS